MRNHGVVIILAGFLALAVSSASADVRPRLKVENDRVLIMDYPGWPGNTWRYRVPEYVIPGRDRGEFRAKPTTKRADGTIVFSGVASSPSPARYSIMATPRENVIFLEARVTNTGREPWNPAAANVLCFEHAGAPDFLDTDGSRTYIRIGERFLAVDKTESPQPHRAHILDPVYFRWLDRVVRYEYYRGSETVSSPLIVRSSKDGRRHVAIAWADARNVSYNLDENLSCMHSEPRFGALKPGESRAIQGRIYFFEGSLEELFERYETDFPDRVRTLLSGAVPSYKEAPVFYEFGWEFYTDRENLELAHEGKLSVGVLGHVPIEDFNWLVAGKESSFWVAMESFWYLLPLIDSERDRDVEFVRQWITGWLDAHELNPLPNYGSKDAMSVGFRAMTFVWYLRTLHERGNSSDVLVARIERNLKWHQRYLRDHYGPVSNHGFWESMGLFETTRVHPDPRLTRLALDRLLEMIRLSVSERGLQMEHSPGYHFSVWNWLKHYRAYLGALGEIQWSDYPLLVDAEKRMGNAMSYLYDHAGNVPQIGDTDARRLKQSEQPARARDNGDADAVLYDEQAGFAIYKDALGRYMVFCIQNEASPVVMPFHYHDDVLAVYYSHNGEIILGDQGRYSYGRGRYRDYYVSDAAHNTIVRSDDKGDPTRQAKRTSQRFKRAQKVSWQPEDDRHRFSAVLGDDRITRVVELPRGEPRIEVLDTIRDDGSHTILWHLGPDVVEVSSTDVAPSGTAWISSWELTTRRGKKLEMTVEIRNATQKKTAMMIKGRMNPYLGWYSPREKVSVPARVIKIDLQVTGEATISTSVAARD